MISDQNSPAAIPNQHHDALQTSTGDTFPSPNSKDTPPSPRSVPYSERPPRLATPHRYIKKQLSRNQRKARRKSRPAQVLASIESSAKQELYFTGRPGKIDLSYKAQYPLILEWHPQQVTLYSILGRFLQHHVEPDGIESEFQFFSWELQLLQSRGYTTASVQAWASCLLESKSNVAAKIFEPGMEMPPLFLVKLFLRRKHIRVLALNTIMIHLNHRTHSKDICWSSIKVLVVRLLRHAREVRPDSIPWIASFFVTEATRLHKSDNEHHKIPANLRADLTSFCNTTLLLLSLPGSILPIVFATYQEKAQLQILQYMANASPAIFMNRKGFRSVTRTQLAHVKTIQERQWAELKGPSWPPWKGNRTAMDEDKGYEFGASRASKVLHRMYEAGYSKKTWENMAEIYAGWDVDNSPTIQTRTSVSRFSSQFSDRKLLRSLIWAGRIRATRTRREAWAGFLACEAENPAVHPEVYLAMFEKLCYSVMKRTPTRESGLESHEQLEQHRRNLLPGDMKEVVPDPESPMHYVHISEPVPTYKQLYQRMYSKLGKPSGRLLALLVETCADFHMIWHMLASNQVAFGHLLAGQHDQDNKVRAMPGYLFAAFIRFLCRFGQLEQPINDVPSLMPPEKHILRFTGDKQYLLEYAYALLMHYRPQYPPAWTGYIQRLVQHKGRRAEGYIPRYKVLCKLFDALEETDIDIDDELFRMFCTGTFYAAQATKTSLASKEDAQFVAFTGWSRLRSYFQTLVGASAEIKFSSVIDEKDRMLFIHIPGPAELHAYVRALGILRDWEGLYSFSIWLAKHHTEVTQRAEARHGGSKLLFSTLVALRAAVEGKFETGTDRSRDGAEGVVDLIKAQIEAVDGWGGWPSREHVDMYVKGQLKSEMPTVDGR